MSLANWYVLADVTVTAAVRQLYPLFRPQSEAAMVDWLRMHTERQTIVLGSYETGNYVAARAGNTVFTGHWAETVDWLEKESLLNRFFSADTDDVWRKALLERYHITHVWFGQYRFTTSASPSRA